MAATLGLVLPACEELDDPGDICIGNPICGPKIPAGPDSGDDPVEQTAWSCVDQPHVVDAPMPMNVGVVTAVVDFFNRLAPVPQLDVKVCLPEDGPCNVNLAQMAQLTFMDGTPAFSMGLQPAFQGYLRMTAPGYLTTEYSFGRELSLNLEEVVPPSPLPVVRTQAMAAPAVDRIDEFFTQAGQTRILGKGLLALRAFDCFGERASDVRFELIGGDTDTAFDWYFVNTRPVDNSGATDPEGVGGFANVSPKAWEVQAFGPDGEVFARVGVDVRPDTLTFVDVRPLGPYARSPNLTP